MEFKLLLLRGASDHLTSIPVVFAVTAPFQQSTFARGDERISSHSRNHLHGVQVVSAVVTIIVGNADRLFNPHGRRHFRRTYSLLEVRVGALILISLGMIAGWVAYKGAHPDPDLLGNDPRLLPKGRSSIVGMGSLRNPPQQSSRASLPTSPSDTSPFSLLGTEPWAPSGWEAGPPSTFGPDNLYEKINGREGFYKSFGFEKLNFITLHPSKQPDTTMDIEWFNLGHTSNALGAFATERPEGATVLADHDGLRYIHRNMSAVVRGSNYIRLIGSDESEAMQTALTTVAKMVVDHIAGAPLPWSFGFFVNHLNIPVQNITVEKDHAFSFDFAKNVHIARVSGDLELFVTAYGSSKEAKTQSMAYRNGFLSLGTDEPDNLIKNRYLETYAAVRHEQYLVYGLRGAASPREAKNYLQQLHSALINLSDELTARAKTAISPESTVPTNVSELPSTIHGPAESAEEETYE